MSYQVGMADVIKSLPNQSFVLSEPPMAIAHQQTADDTDKVKMDIKLKGVLAVTALLVIICSALLYFDRQNQPPTLYDPVSGKTLVAPTEDK